MTDKSGLSLEEQRQVQFFQDALEGRGVIARGRDGVRYTAGLPGPEFWADAPWRLEPLGQGQDAADQEIPFTFIVRDLTGSLDEVALYELPAGGDPIWKMEGPGYMAHPFWVGRTSIPRGRFQTVGPNIRLKAVFTGEWEPLGPELNRKEQCLSIYVASDPLPLRGSAQWYYGDTHYHSDYTNDIKEFGGPVVDAHGAAECIGLDWLILTDHSVDLDDRNPYFEDQRADNRWTALGNDVADSNAQGTVRILRGEEVTVIGRPGLPGGSNTLHLLVFGERLEKLIPGAWARKGLLSLVAASLPAGSKRMVEYLFGTIHGLREVLTGSDEKDKPVAALEGRHVAAQNALAFAAHPTTMAQGAGGTWEDEDLQQAIHGMEAWNARAWLKAGPEECPFDKWEPTGEKEQTKCVKAVERWDEILRWRLENTAEPRFVLLAGSDAHGSFNYSVGLGKDWDGVRADDNCLGKVRTLLYLPEPKDTRQMLSETEVIEAIRTGSCVVTDGPVLNFTLSFNGRKPATLGQSIPTEGDGVLDLKVQAFSTPEFGLVDYAEVVYYIEGMAESRTARVAIGASAQGQGGGSAHSSNPSAEPTPWEVGLPPGSGYVRLQTETSVKTGDGEQKYRCFTNPIWIQSQDDGHRRLRITCVDS